MTELMPVGTDSVELRCSVDGCGKPRKAQGLCGTHYQRKRRNGDPDTVNKSGPKPRNGRDPATRNLFGIAVLGTKSKRTESRFHRTHRIVNYLDEQAHRQFGCTAYNFLSRIGRGHGDKPCFTRSHSGELEYAEVLLYVADECPEDWLRIVNEVCAEEQAGRAKCGLEPDCAGNHTAKRKKKP